MNGFSTFAAHAVAAQRLVLATMLGGGILADVDSGGDGTWWSDAPYPGSQGDEIAKSMYLTAESSEALHHGTLRMTLENSGDHFVMLRYDAKHQGQAVLIVLNMLNQSKQVTVNLALLRNAFGQQPFNLITKKTSAPLERDYTVDMEPFGVQMLQLELPAWNTPGHINCYQEGHGCLDDDRCPKVGYGPVLLTECLLDCISDEEKACEAVSVQWLLDGWVTCYQRGPVDIASCTKSEDESISTFTLRSPPAPSSVSI